MRPLRREPAAVLQLNIGLFCNQACSHCHVESSPMRTEMMDRRTAQRCLELLAASRDTVRTLDLTGGAPELNAQFRWCLALNHLHFRNLLPLPAYPSHLHHLVRRGLRGGGWSREHEARGGQAAVRHTAAAWPHPLQQLLAYY